MSNIKLASRRFFSFIGVLFLLLPFSLHAETQPKFTVEPLTPTTFVLPVNLTATIVYRVTNVTQITRTLTMGPISGVTQITSGTGVCSNPFTLAHGQSCLLTLQVNGGQMQHTITYGPVICKTNGPTDNTPDPFLCSQPSALNSLHIVVGVAMYSVGGTISDLTAAGLILQNNGSNNLSVAAGSVAFLFPPIIPYGGSYNITVLAQPTGQTCLVSNGSGTNVTSNITSVVIHCYPNLVLTAAPSPQKEVGASYSQTNTATGGSSPYTFSVSAGTIPPGTSLNISTGTVSGTPTASGPFSYTIKVTDSVGLTATASSQGTISSQLTLTSTNSTFTEVDVAYSQTNVASGGNPPYAYTVSSGSLPLGTTLNTSTGTVSGTPTTAGNFSYTIQVEDLESVTKIATISGTINGDVTLIATPSVNTTVGVAYSQLNTASGGTLPYVFTLYSGSLPSGTGLSSSTGTVSGTPITAGPFSYVIEVTDNAGKTAIASSSGSIDGAMTLTATPSTIMFVGQPYSQTNVASGGTPPYFYSLNSGALPSGTSLNTSTGTVSGTPTTGGPFSYVIKATDTLSNSAIAPSSGTILGGIIFMSTSKYNGNLGGTSGADAICQSNGITKFPNLTFKAIIVTSTRYPCSNSTTPPTYTPGCMGTYSADWPLIPGVLYDNPDLTQFNSANTNGVFDGTVNQFQFINGGSVPNQTTFWVGFQSSLSGSTSPYDQLGWAYVNMSADSSFSYSTFSPHNCSNFTSAVSTGSAFNGSLGYTGQVITSTLPSSANVWGNWAIQTDDTNSFLNNVWNSTANSIPTSSYDCPALNYIVCIGN